MTKSVDITNRVSYHLQELVLHCVSQERENAHLKKVIRTLAGSVSLTEEGKSEMSLTQEQADYIKKVCDECNVFQIQQ